MEQPDSSPFHDRPVTEEGMPNAEAVEKLMEQRNISYSEADGIINGTPEESLSKAVGPRYKRVNTRGGRSYPERSGRDMTREIEEAASEQGPWIEAERQLAAEGLAAIRKALRDKRQT